ncbi:hypothetical protein [Desulfopila sp. IMCC35008]|uniref:hypothetical protein n=1 Tax=Desulfopila sp. IMCC35008 TaxID=2653858 RepID=UPI0013CF8CDC|nr:hypothetical protein [Desulfopila sp. IMCC35008]
MSIPSKQECFYVLEMIESHLIDFSYTHPWAEQIIMGLDAAPPWLGDLAIKKYCGDQSKSIREYIFSEPFVAGPGDMEKFHVACLWLRYERRELSWATFLRLAGEHLDAANADWDCETSYHYLNVYEDSYFCRESEEQTKRDYLADHNLRPWIEMAKKKFEPFRKMRRANKAN